jgi:hypothetical protein
VKKKVLYFSQMFYIIISLWICFYPLWDHHQGMTLEMACSIWYCNIKYLGTTQCNLLVWMLCWLSTVHGITICLPLPWHNSPPSGSGSPPYRGFTITLRHTTVGRTPLGEWSARRRDLFLTMHDTHKRDIHATSRIRTRNPIKGDAADPRLRSRGHWHRLWKYIPDICSNWALNYTLLPTDWPIDETNSRFSFTLYDMRFIRNCNVFPVAYKRVSCFFLKYIKMCSNFLHAVSIDNFFQGAESAANPVEQFCFKLSFIPCFSI